MRKLWPDFLRHETPKKYAAFFAVFVVLSLILELFVFNFKWISSATAQPLDPPRPEREGAVSLGGELLIKSDSAYLTYSGINRELKYLYLNPGDSCSKTAEITITAVDEANVTGLAAPSRYVRSDVPASQYIRLHFSGEVEELKITIKGLNGETLNGGIKLNARVPLMFSVTRFIIVLLGLMLLFLLRPRSFIYRYKTNLRSNRQRAVILLAVIVQAVALWQIMHWNTAMMEYYKKYENQMQYYKLVDAFKAGRVDIGKAPEELGQLENPYDISARNSNKIRYSWDYAYRNGNYYVYFGAVPVALLYLPYNLITGGNLPHQAAVFILCIMIMLGILLLLWEIVKKWYSDTPFALYLLLSVVVGAGAVLSYAAYKPDLYLVPCCAALMFALFGMALWLSAEREDGRLSCPRLAVGSLCVALIAGCRPQLLLIIAFAVLFFWRAAFKERTLFSRSGIRQTAALCLPFVLVAAVIMLYNHARFGSPFDFGANYNLTTNDMTRRGFVWGRTGLGIFSYLLQPPRVDAEFPFINEFKAVTAYQGLTLQEPMIGGLLWIEPILIFAVCGVFARRSFQNRTPYGMVLISVIIAAVLVVLDTQMAGLLTRYFTDFAWLLLIAASITVFALYSRMGELCRRSLRGSVLALSVITLSVCFLRVFVYYSDSILRSNPQIYYTVMHLTAFWM